MVPRRAVKRLDRPPHQEPPHIHSRSLLDRILHWWRLPAHMSRGPNGTFWSETAPVCASASTVSLNTPQPAASPARRQGHSTDHSDVLNGYRHARLTPRSEGHCQAGSTFVPASRISTSQSDRHSRSTQLLTGGPQSFPVGSRSQSQPLWGRCGESEQTRKKQTTPAFLHAATASHTAEKSTGQFTMTVLDCFSDSQCSSAATQTALTRLERLPSKRR